MSVSADTMAHEPKGRWIAAATAGALAAAVVRFAMDPLAISGFGVSFAAPTIYAFMLRSATGLETSQGIGLLMHVASFVLIAPTISVILSRRATAAGRAAIGIATALALWLLLMIVLMPAAGLPIFYAFSLTMIWSGVAFTILGLCLAGASLIPRK
ncbi:MAG: hypothetical protein AAGK37_19050 [Pseudomonadota bacterium]